MKDLIILILIILLAVALVTLERRGVITMATMRAIGGGILGIVALGILIWIWSGLEGYPYLKLALVLLIYIGILYVIFTGGATIPYYAKVGAYASILIAITITICWWIWYNNPDGTSSDGERVAYVEDVPVIISSTMPREANFTWKKGYYIDATFSQAVIIFDRYHHRYEKGPGIMDSAIPIPDTDMNTEWWIMAKDPHAKPWKQTITVTEKM